MLSRLTFLTNYIKNRNKQMVAMSKTTEKNRIIKKTKFRFCLVNYAIFQMQFDNLNA